MEDLLFSIININSYRAFFTFSNFLGDRSWLMGALNCQGPLVFELTLPNEHYATDGMYVQDTYIIASGINS
jgi:hypothetical protein